MHPNAGSALADDPQIVSDLPHAPTPPAWFSAMNTGAVPEEFVICVVPVAV